MTLATEGWRAPFALVLKGGSTKGLAYLGAIAVLYHNGYVPTAIAGSSAGSITAFFLACAHARCRQQEEGKRKDLSAFIIDSLDELQKLDPAVTFFGLRFWTSLTLGFRLLFLGHLASGEGLERWIKRQLGLIRWPSELSTVGQLQDAAGMPLFMTLSSTRHGLEFAGEKTPVVEAVRASSALPFVFKPISAEADSAAETRGTTKANLWLDGGLLQNLPVALYASAR